MFCLLHQVQDDVEHGQGSAETDATRALLSARCRGCYQRREHSRTACQHASMSLCVSSSEKQLPSTYRGASAPRSRLCTRAYIARTCAGHARV